MVSVQAMASEKDFWSWFSKNQLDIEKYESGDEKLLDEIMLELHKYNKNLYFEFSTHEKINEFIITAEGEIQQFDSAFNLVNSAPKFENWKIMALKPAMGFDFITTYEGIDYNPDDLWFLPLSSNANPNILGLRVVFLIMINKSISIQLQHLGSYLKLDWVNIKQLKIYSI